MRNKRLVAVVAGAAVMLLAIVVLSGVFRGQDRITPASEPEKGGGSSISVSGTDKLNALLPPAEFYAAKDALSTYVQNRFGDDIAANIEDTNLNADGSISLRVDAEGEQFTARVFQQNGELYFEVPATYYQVHRTRTEINDMYQGIPNE